MNVESLQVGQKFKNYKELCESLSMETKKSTHSKKAQLKELERYCKLSKVGHQFTIKEVYHEPLETKDKRKEGNNSVFSNMAQLLILDLLADSDKPTIVLTKNRLLNHISMINKNYSFCSENVPQLSEFMNIDPDVIYDFYNTSNSNFKNTLETALESLRNKSLAMHEKVTSICINVTEDRKIQEHRIATEQEKHFILRCEKRVLKMMNYKSLPAVRKSPDWNRFKKAVESLLHEESDIEYYYASYKITINEEYIYEEYDDLLHLILGELKRKEYKNQLNSTVLDKLIANAERRHKNGKGSDRMLEVRSKSGYIDDTKRLIDTLIDHNAKDISWNLKQIGTDRPFKVDGKVELDIQITQ